MNLLDAFERHVCTHPDRVAIIDPKGRSWSYQQLNLRSQALSTAFARKGLGRGDRVLLAMGVQADLYAALAALWRIGAVAVLPEPALGLAGIKRALESLRPKASLLGGPYRLLPLFVPQLRKLDLSLYLRGMAGQAPPIADIPPEAPALISFTTGSTGAPKAIVRSHGFMQAQDNAVAPLIGTHGRHEIDLVGFPVFVVANLGQGITSVLPDWPARRMDKADGRRIARLVARHKVTRLLLNPALVERLVRVGIPDQVHAIFTGGGPVFPQVIRQVMSERPDMRFVAVYGSTEAEPIAEIDARDISAADFEAMADGKGLLVGCPVAAAQVRIVDDEIQVAGNHVVQGYLDPARDKESKSRDAQGVLWHRTGDAGWLDDQGRIWLLGRLGSQVGALWPFPVENAARCWPGADNAALVNQNGTATLIIEGDVTHLNEWRIRAAGLGLASVRHLQTIPMDRRHGSKVDYGILMRLLN